MTRRPASSALRSMLVIGATASLLLSLAACGPSPAPSPAASSAPATAAPTPEEPVFHPDGTAEENLPVFTAVTEKIWATDQRGSGRAYIDALVAAGFDKGAMQVTRDTSTVGNPAESMQFSVRWGDEECLVGQVGPSTGEPVTAVMPQLAEGRCLIGETRAIDW